MTEDRLGETLFYTLIFIWPALVTYCCLTALHGEWRKLSWLYLSFYFSIGIRELYSFAGEADWDGPPLGIYFVPVTVIIAMVTALAVNFAHARTETEFVREDGGRAHVILTSGLFLISCCAAVVAVIVYLSPEPGIWRRPADGAALAAIIGAPLIMLPQQLSRQRLRKGRLDSRPPTRTQARVLYWAGSGFLLVVAAGYFGLFAGWPGKQTFILLSVIGAFGLLVGTASIKLKMPSLSGAAFGLAVASAGFGCLAAYSACAAKDNVNTVAAGNPFCIESHGRPVHSQWDMSILTMRAALVPFSSIQDHRHAFLSVSHNGNVVRYAWSLRRLRFIAFDGWPLDCEIEMLSGTTTPLPKNAQPN